MEWAYKHNWIEKDPFIERTDKGMIAIVTSYEIVCATARRAPNIEYLELDAQPHHRMEYTERLDVAKINNRISRFRLTRGLWHGEWNSWA